MGNYTTILHCMKTKSQPNCRNGNEEEEQKGESDKYKKRERERESRREVV